MNGHIARMEIGNTSKLMYNMKEMDQREK